MAGRGSWWVEGDGVALARPARGGHSARGEMDVGIPLAERVWGAQKISVYQNYNKMVERRASGARGGAGSVFRGRLGSR